MADSKYSTYTPYLEAKDVQPAGWMTDYEKPDFFGAYDEAIRRKNNELIVQNQVREEEARQQIQQQIEQGGGNLTEDQLMAAVQQTLQSKGLYEPALKISEEKRLKDRQAIYDQNLQFDNVTRLGGIEDDEMRQELAQRYGMEDPGFFKKTETKKNTVTTSEYLKIASFKDKETRELLAAREGLETVPPYIPSGEGDDKKSIYGEKSESPSWQKALERIKDQEEQSKKKNELNNQAALEYQTTTPWLAAEAKIKNQEQNKAQGNPQGRNDPAWLAAKQVTDEQMAGYENKQFEKGLQTLDSPTAKMAYRNPEAYPAPTWGESAIFNAQRVSNTALEGLGGLGRMSSDTTGDGWLGVSRALMGIGDEAKMRNEEIAAFTQGQTKGQKFVSKVSDIGGSLLPLALPGGIPLMIGTASGGKYNQLRDSGSGIGKSALGAGTSGLTTAALLKLPMRTLNPKVAPSFKKAAASFGELGAYGAGGVLADQGINEAILPGSTKDGDIASGMAEAFVAGGVLGPVLVGGQGVRTRLKSNAAAIELKAAQDHLATYGSKELVKKPEAPKAIEKTQVAPDVSKDPNTFASPIEVKIKDQQKVVSKLELGKPTELLAPKKLQEITEIETQKNQIKEILTTGRYTTGKYKGKELTAKEIEGLKVKEARLEKKLQEIKPQVSTIKPQDPITIENKETVQASTDPFTRRESISKELEANNQKLNALPNAKKIEGRLNQENAFLEIEQQKLLEAQSLGDTKKILDIQRSMEARQKTIESLQTQMQGAIESLPTRAEILDQNANKLAEAAAIEKIDPEPIKPTPEYEALKVQHASIEQQVSSLRSEALNDAIDPQSANEKLAEAERLVSQLHGIKTQIRKLNNQKGAIQLVPHPEDIGSLKITTEPNISYDPNTGSKVEVEVIKESERFLQGLFGSKAKMKIPVASTIKKYYEQAVTLPYTLAEKFPHFKPFLDTVGLLSKERIEGLDKKQKTLMPFLKLIKSPKLEKVKAIIYANRLAARGKKLNPQTGELERLFLDDSPEALMEQGLDAEQIEAYQAHRKFAIDSANEIIDTVENNVELMPWLKKDVENYEKNLQELQSIQNTALEALAGKDGFSNPTRIDNLKRSVEAVETYKAKMAEIRQEMIASHYTPLMRFGEYYVTSKSMFYGQGYRAEFETQAARDADVKRLQKIGVRDIKAGKKLEPVKDDFSKPDFDPELSTIPTEILEALAPLYPNIAQHLRRTMPETTVVPADNIESLAGMKARFQQADFVPGYSEDMVRSLSKYASDVTNWSSGKNFRTRANKAIENIPKDEPSLISYAQKLRDDTLGSDSGIAQKIRLFTTLYYLGKPMSFVNNLTQGLTHTIPTLVSETGANKQALGFRKAYKIGSLAYKTTAEYLAAKLQNDNLPLVSKAGQILKRRMDRRNPGLFDLLEQISKEDWMKPEALQSFIGLSRGVKNLKGKTIPEELRDAIMSFQSGSEILNRTHAAISAFDVAVNEKGIKGVTDVRNYIKQVVDKTQFIYGMENRPQIMRGPIGGTLGRQALMFKTFSGNHWKFLKRNMRPGHFKTAIATLGTQSLLGGLTVGIPYGPTLFKFLEGLGVDVYGATRQQLDEWSVPEEVQRGLFLGVPASISDFNLSPSLSSGELLPGLGEDVATAGFKLAFGAAADIPLRVQRAAELHGKGMNQQAIEEIISPWGRGVSRALRFDAEEGLANFSDKPLMKNSKNPISARITMMMGGTPATMSWEQQKVSTDQFTLNKRNNTGEYPGKIAREIRAGNTANVPSLMQEALINAKDGGYFDNNPDNDREEAINKLEDILGTVKEKTLGWDFPLKAKLEDMPKSIRDDFIRNHPEVETEKQKWAREGKEKEKAIDVMLMQIRKEYAQKYKIDAIFKK